MLIAIDCVFFQMFKTGIARVWKSLLEEWAINGFGQYLIILDRAGTAPQISGLKYHIIPPCQFEFADEDSQMLQIICDKEGADLFISSYYTTPLTTPAVFMAYDMIPEVFEWDLRNPMWQAKHHGIQYGSKYITISENTARDLIKFFPEISPEQVTVALCGIDDIFKPAAIEEVDKFKIKYGISKPYFILVGAGGGYKNTIHFLRAFAQLATKQAFDIVCTGSGFAAAQEWRSYTSGSAVYMLQLEDEELRLAYAGAIALVYPSKYEGFGLPVLEAIACGCPVITCPNASIPEVSGEAALYVKDDDVNELVNALCDVQKPDIRKSLIAAGLKQAKKFSWSTMAQIVSSVLIETTLLSLKLRDINLIIFPDWDRLEESLYVELEQIIRMMATHPEREYITLLIHNGKLSEDDANLILSSIAMNLLMNDDLNIDGELDISLVGNLVEPQWLSLLPHIRNRIIMNNENQEAISATKAENIPVCEIDSLIGTKFT